VFICPRHLCRNRASSFVVSVSDDHGPRAEKEEVMADFVLLYTGGGMPKSEAEQAKVMEAWNAWYATIGDSAKDGGNPFGPAAKTVSGDGSVKDGSLGPQHTGFTIASSASLETATDVAKGSPVLQGGGSVTVYEVVEAM
jgi:hypothetical protein